MEKLTNLEKEKLKKLGERIKALSEKKYETNKDFAIAADCSPEYTSRVMKGKKNPSYIKLDKMAKALDATIDELGNEKKIAPTRI